MAKYDTKAKTTYTRPEPDAHKQDWKRDRYAQRDAKVTARRNITGGF
jgi:hypothetical protein